MNTDRRFWSKVNRSDSHKCWNWTGSTTNRGYGKFKLHGKTVATHRLAWIISRRCEIPDGKLILHHCDNPLCCNPMHLYCGTQSDNMKDREMRNPIPLKYSHLEKLNYMKERFG